MQVASITVKQVHGDFQWDPKSYRWSVLEFGLMSDECVGMPVGSGKHTIAAALMEAIAAAQNLGYTAARISYLFGDHQIKTMDCELDVEPVTIERARTAADKLLNM